MSSNPTGFKIYCGTEYPASKDYYDLDDLFIRKENFTRGGLWVWGSGLGGQLGNDLTTSRSSPVQTCIRGSRWRKVCLSKHDGHFALALSTTGQVWGWGCNDTYQMADGTTGDYLCPRRISARKDINIISAGGASATIYTPGESDRYIWGCIEGGRAGLETTTAICTAPSLLDSDKKWVDISMGNRFGVGIIDSCVESNILAQTRLEQPGNLVEWGGGRPSSLYRNFPRCVNSRNYSGGTNGYTRVSGGAGTEPLALSDDYTIEFFTCQPAVVGTYPQIVFDMRCALTSPGSYMPRFTVNASKCLGFSVRLANGVYSNVDSTLSMADDKWYHVAASRIGNSTQFFVNGTRYGCVCDNFNHVNTCITIAADGANTANTSDCYAGSLSNIRIVKGAGIYSGTRIDIPAPPLALIANVTADTSLLLSANNRFIDESSYSLTVTDITMTNTVEQFCIESRAITTLTSNSVSWKSVSAGNSHAIALKCDGTLWVWGSNHKGQLGTGDTIDRSRPVQVGTSNNWTAITAGCNFSAAILAGSFRCNAAVIYSWGENSRGQLGINTTTDRSSPTQISSDCTNWKKLSGGDSHFAALQTDSTIWAWGSNEFGELGKGDRVDRSSPIQVLGNTTGWYEISAGQCATAGLREDAW
jgi:Regulator of chromosome condensation (RCC1) repeat/Concanavalin A-like lectin/glucanases superfamily